MKIKIFAYILLSLIILASVNIPVYAQLNSKPMMAGQTSRPVQFGYLGYSSFTPKNSILDDNTFTGLPSGLNMISIGNILPPAFKNNIIFRLPSL
jgi:hypothetical protein